MNFLTAAFELTRFGFKVFPLQPGGKKPVIAGNGGCKAATDDEDQIAEWAAEYPTANIGILCGAQSGVTVVDIDVKQGAGGVGSLKALAQKGFTLPQTVTSETPSGGVHFYFAFDARVPNSAGKIGAGIDIRSQNGYVVGPPSIMAGGAAYNWKRKPLGTTFPKLPDWLIRAAQPQPTIVSPHKPMTPKTAHEGFERQIDRLGTAREGTRNETLYKTSVYAKMRGAEGLLNPSEARARVFDTALSLGLPKPEIEATIASAWREQR